MTLELENQLLKIGDIINPKLSSKLKDIFLKHVKFVAILDMHDDTIDITDLMNEYKIEGYELFYFMNKATLTSGFGIIEYDKTKDSITMEQAKEIFDENHGYFDWYNGKAFKTGFRVNNKDKQELQRRRIDARNYYGCTYYSVLLAINYKLT